MPAPVGKAGKDDRLPQNLSFNIAPKSTSMKHFITVSALLATAALLSGCSDNKPRMVAEPNAYEAYQASPEELQAQQDEMKSKAKQPKRAVPTP